jgi:hypothetical protein
LDSKINDSVLGVGVAPCVNAGITAGNLSSDFDTARLGKIATFGLKNETTEDRI